MPKAKQKLRIAMPAWEIGRVSTGLGAKVGGLAVVVEELPRELIKAAAKQNIDLEIEILSPCFAYHNKNKLTKLELQIPVTLDGHSFEFEVYEHIFPDGQKVVYFWDEGQLGWTTPSAIYPVDQRVGLRLYAAVGQAMAYYIKQEQFDTVHLHDYHVGLVPFYLGDSYLERTTIHFTIHNATYQGIVDLSNDGDALLEQINLFGERLFSTYFDFGNKLNMMKACILKVHENGGKITTVSGDIAGTWGYAAELKMSYHQIWEKAFSQKGSAPGEVFLPNLHLDLFEKLPIAGITNGMSDTNRPENLPELQADVLRAMQEREPSEPIFSSPVTQVEMLSSNHNFDADSLEIKAELKRLLHLEAFGTEPQLDPIVFTAVGRLVEQKNLGLIVNIVERTLEYDGGTRFIILASAPKGDPTGRASEAAFFHLSTRFPDRVYFNNSFNLPLSKLIFAGGDFSLIPSRFEPCGLVDYEASLLGNIVIGRATGGLTKVSHCGYLYEWLDVSDRAGEANAFFAQIARAIDVYRHDSERHLELMRTAMDIDSGWDTSATQYINMYRYGALVKTWHAERQALIQKFTASLKKEQRLLFAEFFIPGRQEYSDVMDWQLKNALKR